MNENYLIKWELSELLFPFLLEIQTMHKNIQFTSEHLKICLNQFFPFQCGLKPQTYLSHSGLNDSRDQLVS